MKILFINAVCGVTSTGRICAELAQKFDEEGHICKIAYGRSERISDESQKYAVYISNRFAVKMHAIYTRLFDKHGCGIASKKATESFINWAEQYKPDLLWLHNLHGYYINYEVLFAWIKRHPEMKVKWTLHDCWAFTGHCTYFTAAKCEKWKTHCNQCSEKKKYPQSWMLDNSWNNFEKKKNSFTGIKDLELITPSQWLADLTRQSFLKEYPVQVCHNSIDREIFRPIQSDFRKKYHLESKIIILGVANVWSARKGFDDFLKLAEMLDDKYRIILVGLTKRQISQAGDKVLGIEKTNNKAELAEIYSAADIFLIPAMKRIIRLLIWKQKLAVQECLHIKQGGHQKLFLVRIREVYQLVILKQ